MSAVNSDALHKIVGLIKLSRVLNLAADLLVIWPYIYGLTFAAITDPGIIPLAYLKNFFTLVVYGCLTNAVGTVWNDIVDKDLDSLNPRTKSRPLVSGDVSVIEALGFLSLLVVALMVIMSTFNPVAAKLSLIGGVILPGIYPYTKRITYWPQTFLGITLSWNTLVGWAVTANQLRFDIILPLLLGLSCWTIAYDSKYAIQDREDDVRCGVKSTAVLFGDNITLLIAVASTIFLGGLSAAGLAAGLGLPFFTVSIAGGAFFLIRQYNTIDLQNAHNNACVLFDNGYIIGMVVFVGLLWELVKARGLSVFSSHL